MYFASYELNRRENGQFLDVCYDTSVYRIILDISSDATTYFLN